MIQEGVVAGNRRAIGRLGLAVSAVVFAVLLFSPAAQAQYTPTPWGANDTCASVGPNGRAAADPFNNINVTVSGGGSVTPWHVQHAGAVHLAAGATPVLDELHVRRPDGLRVPLPARPHAAVRLDGAARRRRSTAGAHFLGWNANCSPIKGTATVPVPRTTCIVSMNTDHAATAVFGPAPDSTQPSAPTLSVAPGSYSAVMNWSASTDDYLAGYDIYKDGTHLARVTKNSTAFQVDNLACENTFTLQVRAYDSVHEARATRSRSGPGSARART